MEAFYEGFGRRLRQLRRSAGLTQEQLARRLGLNRTTVVNIEGGRQRVAVHQLVELADALGCEPSELLLAAGMSYEALSTSKVQHDGPGADFLLLVQAKKASRR